jgi:hypothetical protein
LKEKDSVSDRFKEVRLHKEVRDKGREKGREKGWRRERGEAGT